MTRTNVAPIATAAFMLLLFACPSPGLVTGTNGVYSQEGYSLNTQQTCQQAQVAVDVADRALRLAFLELAKAGYIDDVGKALSERPMNKVAVCLIRDPEECAIGGVVGPFGPTLSGAKRPLAARKYGCTDGWGSVVWSAVCWPPKCRPEWPDEPHCTTGASTSANWESGFVHEMINLARARWARGAAATQGDYSQLPALFGPNGVESRVKEAYGPMTRAIGTTCN